MSEEGVIAVEMARGQPCGDEKDVVAWEKGVLVLEARLWLYGEEGVCSCSAPAATSSAAAARDEPERLSSRDGEVAGVLGGGYVRKGWPNGDLQFLRLLAARKGRFGKLWEGVALERAARADT